MNPLRSANTTHSELLKRIAVRPDIFAGKPIIRDLRISVELILKLSCLSGIGRRLKCKRLSRFAEVGFASPNRRRPVSSTIGGTIICGDADAAPLLGDGSRIGLCYARSGY